MYYDTISQKHPQNMIRCGLWVVEHLTEQHCVEKIYIQAIEGTGSGKVPIFSRADSKYPFELLLAGYFDYRACISAAPIHLWAYPPERVDDKEAEISHYDLLFRGACRMRKIHRTQAALVERYGTVV